MEWLTAMRASEKRWQEDPIVADLLRQYPRKGSPAEFRFPFSSKSINSTKCSKILEGDGDIQINRSSKPWMHVCHEPCLYKIRKDAKKCKKETPFVSVSDIFSKNKFDDGDEHYFKNVSIGGLLTNFWSDASCWIGDKKSCCIYCSQNLKLEEAWANKCIHASFFPMFQNYFAEKLFEKSGIGNCCKMETLQQKVIVWGDLIIADNSMDVIPYDVCLVENDPPLENKLKWPLSKRDSLQCALCCLPVGRILLPGRRLPVLVPAQGGFPPREEPEERGALLEVVGPPGRPAVGRVAAQEAQETAVRGELRLFKVVPGGTWGAPERATRAGRGGSAAWVAQARGEPVRKGERTREGTLPELEGNPLWKYPPRPAWMLTVLWAVAWEMFFIEAAAFMLM